MEERLSCALGTKDTKVLFASDIKDLSHYLSSYGDNVFWIFDTNTRMLFSRLPEKNIVLDSGEENKSMRNLEKIITAALSFGSARDTRFIAFGGGVVLDMAALAASLYMRGTRLTLVPTTLLSMVDASIGGKSAIDYAGAKNIIGTFYPADEVIISADVLRSLPEREYKCGLGEVIKHAFLSDDLSLYNFLVENRDEILSRDKEKIRKMIYLSLQIKKYYIEQDPQEKKGIRSCLNFGHTFGHALESISSFKISHGEAVVWGMRAALDAGRALKITEQECYEKAVKLMNSYGYNTERKIGRGEWLSYAEAISKDKKKSGGSVKFVLLKNFGSLILTPLEKNTIQEAVLQSARIKF